MKPNPLSTLSVRIVPVTVRPLIPAARHAAARSDNSTTAPDESRGVHRLVCQLVCQLALSRITIRDFLGNCGDPDFHQLEPDGELAKPAPGAPRSRIVKRGTSLRITSS